MIQLIVIFLYSRKKQICDSERELTRLTSIIAVFILPGGGIKTRHAWQSSASILHLNFLNNHGTYNYDFRRVRIALSRRGATKRFFKKNIMYKCRNGTNTIASLTANFCGIGSIVFSDFLKIYSSISNIVQSLVFS